MRVLRAMKSRWFGGVLWILVCSGLISYYINGIWRPSIDVALHYSLVARLSEHWQLPNSSDPSLGRLSTYPRYAHRLAALVGNVIGSPFAGMQLVTRLSLAGIWTSIAFLFLALPRRILLWTGGVLAALLVANQYLIHLELFGSELVGNYFYPQIVAQAIALALIALALWLERSPIPKAIIYVILGSSVPLLQQVHLLPAVEIMGTLSLLVVLDAIDLQARNRGKTLLFGVFCIAASLFLTVESPAFSTMIYNSEHGLMSLKYTPTVQALAVEAVIAIGASAVLLWRWISLSLPEARRSMLTIKYLGLFGEAVGMLCLLQIVLLQFGYGSFYACQKFAFGINTTLLLEACFLPALSIPSLRSSVLDVREASPIWLSRLSIQAIPSLFVLFGFLTNLPSPTTAVTVGSVVSAERSVKAYAASNPMVVGKKYEYAIDLFPGQRVFDYLISTGVLKSPRAGNADDLLNSQPLSNPEKVGRIYSAEGSRPWDILACRQAVLPPGIVVLNGPCVIQTLQAAGIKTVLPESASP